MPWFPPLQPDACPGRLSGRARLRRAASWLAGITLAGCASYGPGALPAGASGEVVRAALGPPSLELPRPEGGVRLVYARGPMGRETYMLDLDASGRLQRWHQALGEAQFAQLPQGLSREELLYRIGPPAEIRPVGRLPGSVWSWRYANNDCLWFQAGVDEQGRYTGGGYGQDPRCDVNDRPP